MEPRLLSAGDVYRRDSIDQSHYPVFHQMEGETNLHGKRCLRKIALARFGLACFSIEGGLIAVLRLSCCESGVKVLDRSQYSDAASGIKAAELELKETLEALAAHLFGTGIEVGPHTCSSLFADQHYGTGAAFASIESRVMLKGLDWQCWGWTCVGNESLK